MANSRSLSRPWRQVISLTHAFQHSDHYEAAVTTSNPSCLALAAGKPTLVLLVPAERCDITITNMFVRVPPANQIDSRNENITPIDA